MKTFSKMAAQGDLLIRRIDNIPSTAREVAPVNGLLVVAHSETGHHHAIAVADRDAVLFDIGDTLRSLLRVSKPVKLAHHRSFDTHETIEILPGDYEIRRQREHTPEGWRRVED